MKTETIPVVIGALGLIKKGLDKVIRRIQGNINTNEMQQVTMLETAHISVMGFHTCVKTHHIFSLGAFSIQHKHSINVGSLRG